MGCVLFTALLYFAQPEYFWFAVLCLIASNFFFGSGAILVAAFLPEISRVRALGRVSGWGWSLGYVGGLLTLGLCLLYVAWAESQGQAATQFVPVTMLITAAVFALASLPTFCLLRERAVPRAVHNDRLWAAWQNIWLTLRHFTDLRRFLLCSLFYQSGIQAVIILTAIYASQETQFSTQRTLLLVLLAGVQVPRGRRAASRELLSAREGARGCTPLALLNQQGSA